MYYGARYYDPALARFITPDTVDDAGTQGLNRYAYALNNFLCIKRKYRQIQEEILDKIRHSPHCLEKCQSHRACEEEEGIMEVRLNLGYHQILQLIRQLPPREQWRLTHDIEDDLRLRDLSPEPNDDVAQFQALLLRGPIMSDEQFRQIQELRQGLSAWLERSFV
ncbi:hypothetical protein U14_03644 [Candidatus Moduliflexus flocculans]|uniref:YD repeat protein n=1 Tax=Candidatus Moduliflexus flocculans TaxID=1499966 RepID=A0A081BPS7_9BACT|nr:hypothetical protein U14_03644 [Candidatus Moduliflexus flocculans]